MTFLFRPGSVAAAAVVIASLTVIAPAAWAPAAWAEEGEEGEEAGYMYAGGITPVVTFEFRDGTEVHEFPVFAMGDGFIANTGSPSFTLAGIVGEAPHLHRMLDTAFKHRHSGAHQWNYQHAEITVDFMRGTEPVRTLAYHDCRVEDYRVTTLTDDYESYMSSKTGFALVYEIEFRCGGLLPSSPSEAGHAPGTVRTYGTDLRYHGDTRAVVEFGFDRGTERIEFPYFELRGGFEEDTANAVPSFRVEGMVGDYPLLHRAIDGARDMRGAATHHNAGFEADVRFVRGDLVLRELEFGDCRATSYAVRTLFDKEEGFTGKGGFSPVEVIGFECAGLHGAGPRHTGTYGPGYASSGDMTVVAAFEHDQGVETAVFPVFVQGGVLGLTGLGSPAVSVPPTFRLAGGVGDAPVLYGRADENLALSFTTGAGNFVGLFGVDIRLVRGAGEHAKTVRGFEYDGCRITDYTIMTQRDNEASYFKGFAHSDMFDFECTGYHPYDPAYDALFAYERPDVQSSADYQAAQYVRGGVQPLFD